MLLGFSFRARPGKAAQLQALLNDPDAGRRVAQAMGASRNILLWQGDRMVRILEFDEGVEPVPLRQIAAENEHVAAFLAKVGELAEPAVDPADPAGVAAFDEAAALQVLYDVRA